MPNNIEYLGSGYVINPLAKTTFPKVETVMPGLTVPPRGWWRADFAFPNSNDTWPDLTGNNKPFKAPNSTRPTVVTGELNSKPALLFDGVDDLLRTEYRVNLVENNNTTIFIVGDLPITRGRNSGGNWNVTFPNITGTPRQVSIQTANVDNSAVSTRTSTGTGYTAGVQSAKTMKINFDFGGDTTFMNLYNNGELISSDAFSNEKFALWSIDWELGNFKGDSFTGGKIYEVIMFAGMTPDDLGIVHNYLNGRYGVGTTTTTTSTTVAPSMLPSDISNLQMWMDAAHPSYNSDGVGRWPNKGLDAAEMGCPGGGTNLPVYSATGGMKSKPAIVYDGVNDRHQGEIMMGTGSFTLVLVGNMPIAKGYDGFGNGWGLIMGARADKKVSYVLTSGGAAAYSSSGVLANSSANSIRAIRFDNTTGASVMHYYENGVLLSSTPQAKNDLRTSAIGWYIGNDLNTLSTFFSGNVSEILGYDKLLTQTEFDNLHNNYLLPKYV